MKLLHTADWHLKDRLGWVDRSDDLCGALREIAAVLSERAVDVMIVAGDLFRERLRKEELQDAVSEIAEIFAPFLSSGGTIVAVPGNHDSRAHFETLRDTMKLAPGVGAGRMYFVANADRVVVESRVGEKVQLVCLPYPDESFLRRAWNSGAEQNASRQETCQRILTKLGASLEPTLPAILVSHIHMFGVPVGSHSDYQIGAEHDVQLTPSDMGLERYSYVALGHIHKPQTIGNRENFRYCGSIQRLDRGEKDDEKGIVLVEITPGQPDARVEWTPLQSTRPLRDITLDGEAGLENLAPDTDSLVHATIRYIPGIDNRGKIKRRLRELYPKLYAIAEERVETPGGPARAVRNLVNVEENAREYLRTAPNIGNRDALLSLLEEIL